MPLRLRVCTVTGFGDSIRFALTKVSIDELLLLKARARSERGQIAVFFIDDTLRHNVKRTKSLLRDIIRRQTPRALVAQIAPSAARRGTRV